MFALSTDARSLTILNDCIYMLLIYWVICLLNILIHNYVLCIFNIYTLYLPFIFYYFHYIIDNKFYYHI